MRVVVAARLSQLHDGQTGLDTQEQGVAQWAEANGHEVVGIAADHQKGTSHLWQRPKLKPWVADPVKLGEYDAIVALKMDRLTRADDEGVSALKDWARKNGKRIFITSAGVEFPSEGVAGLLWDAYVRMAHQEWLAIQERYLRMQAAKHEAGSLVGKAPWGYVIVKVGGVKTLEPTPEGRLWVPQVFGWIAEGRSPRWVGKALEDNGVRSGAEGGRWHEGVLIKMIKRQTYSGMRPRKGLSALTVEPLVSRALQDKAIAMVESRARLGASATVQPKALLAKLKCGHPDCPGAGTWPMYRNKPRDYPPVYRCAGRGAQRKGCGAPIVIVETLDNLVLNMSEYWDAREYIAQRFVAGNEIGIRLDQLRAEMAEAMRVAPAGKIATVAGDYAARIEALEGEGSVQPHWEDIHTGKSEGQHLQGLDLDGQRDYLGRKDIKAWKDAEGRVCVTVDGFLARTGGRSVVGEMIKGS